MIVGSRSSATGRVPCRFCGTELTVVLDLGAQPPAGVFPTAAEAATLSLLPLRLAVCPACGLAQLADDSPPEVDPAGAPPPTSSATMADHARRFVDQVLAPIDQRTSLRVLDLASHGGHLWPFFRERGVDAFVVETNEGWAEELQAAGATIVASSVRDVAGLGESFDLIVDHYLLAHLDDPDEAIGALAGSLRPGGRLVLEFDDLEATVSGLQFDAIRHGHRTFLTRGWVARTLARHGLTVSGAERQPVYGGAMRVTATRDARGHLPTGIDPAEGDALSRPEAFAAFVGGVERLREATVDYLDHARSAGRRILGYGAPARAVTFLNAFSIGPDLLPMTADRSAAKQDRVIPGTGTPIVSPDAIRDAAPEEILVLAWDLAREIRASMPWLETGGGRFTVAVPRLAIIGEDGLRPV
jgi:SAM-dependent methyltransferase